MTGNESSKISIVSNDMWVHEHTHCPIQSSNQSLPIDSIETRIDCRWRRAIYVWTRSIIKVFVLLSKAI